MRVTYVNMMPPAHTDWNNNLLMEMNTVVGSHQEKAVYLHQSILASVTSLCVDKWLDMKRMVLMDFGHLTYII